MEHTPVTIVTSFSEITLVLAVLPVCYAILVGPRPGCSKLTTS